MKTILRPAALLLCLILNVSTAISGDVKKEEGTTPFVKNSWYISLYKPIRFSSTKETYGNSSIKYSDFNFNPEFKFFFQDNKGVGLNLDMSRSVSDNYYKDIQSRYLISGSYLQGFKLTGMNMLAEFSAGIGTIKDVNKSTDIKETTGLTRLRLGVGPVLKFCDRQPFLFHPYVGIMYARNNFDNHKENITNFFIKADLVFNLNCSESVSDCESDFEDVHSRFVKGTNVFNASTMTDLKIGGLMEKYDNQDYKYSTNSQALNINYRYFIADNLSVGGWTSISRDHQKQKGDEVSQNYSTNTDIIIGPGITYQLPLGKYYENIFLDFNLGAGVNSNKSYGSKSKVNIIGGFADVGYDFGLSHNLSICPALGYKWYNYKNPDNDTHYNEKGVILNLGMRTNF